jgi:hypothetical protein
LPSALIPTDPLAFVRHCIASGRVRWTYHVTMRLQERRLNGEVLRQSIDTLEIIETYPHDKYLPSFLLRGEVPEFVFHALMATDLEGDNVRVVTMYLPDPDRWDENGRLRRVAR